MTAVYPEPGAGTECGPRADDGCGVPIDAPIEVRFDRYLLPKTAVRQSLVLYPAGEPKNQLFLEPVYDVVERVVSYRPESGTNLGKGLLYEVELRLPEEDKDGFGFRSFDGAGLEEEGSVRVKWSFRTSRVAGGGTAADSPPTCEDALGVFASSGCMACHAEGPEAPMGLALDSARALRETAIGHVAREADIGPVAGRTLVDPPRFGVGMSIIDAGNPANSYLFYKLLANPENFGEEPCRTIHTVPLPGGECLAPSRVEIQHLEDWFLRLDPMPPEGEGDPVGLPNLRTLQEFIRAGARTAECR